MIDKNHNMSYIIYILDILKNKHHNYYRKKNKTYVPLIIIMFLRWIMIESV